MPELCKALPAVASADSAQELPAQVQEELRQARAVQARELQVWCSPPWASVRRYLRMIPRSSLRLERSIRPPRWRTSEFMECPCCNSIPGRLILASARHLRQDRASLSSSTTTARPRIVLSLISLPLWG